MILDIKSLSAQICNFPLQNLLGLFFFLGIAYFLSENKRLIKMRHILRILIIQFIVAASIIFFPFLRYSFKKIGIALKTLNLATLEGTKFVFGYIGGGEAPFEIPDNLKSNVFILAFQALPIIIVASAFSMVLFHWRIIPIIVSFLSRISQKFLHIGGALAIVVNAKALLGPMESFALVRPYLKDFSRSELFIVMTCAMSTTSISTTALYGLILRNTLDDPISHILISSVVSIFSSILLARIIVPEGEENTIGDLTVSRCPTTLTAITKGTIDGLNVFLNVVAMLIVSTALVFLFNHVLNFLLFWNEEKITLQLLLGKLMAPITWFVGIPWQETSTAGQLLGIKMVLNEIFAFTELTKSNLSSNSILIMTYALCGFANFSFMGILIGGLGAMIPERQNDIISLAFKSLIAGTLSTLLSASIIGMLIFFQN